MSARAIVLAAGKGTRMKSARQKVLHELCGRPMLWWVLEALRAAGVDSIVVVSNPELDSRLAPFGVRTVVQHEQLGTGHAVRIALEALDPGAGTLVVAYGDMPLVDATIFEDVQAAVDPDAGTALALVTARMPLPSSFGRIVREGSAVAAIVEAKDCTSEQLAIDEMNAGIYGFDEPALRETIGRIGNDNAQREFYLTDTVALLNGAGRRVVPVAVADYRSVLGVNDRVELAEARAIRNRRLCEAQMRAGVTIVDPAATYLDAGVAIGADTVIYPNTSIAGETRIGERCAIGPGCRIGERADRRRGADHRERDPRLVDRHARADRPVRARAGRREDRRRRADRRLRRGEERRTRRRREGEPPGVHRRRQRRGRARTTPPARSPATTTGSAKTVPRSAPTSSSARTTRWSRR